MPHTLPETLLTRKEAAAFLRISPVTLARWDADGRHGIPHVRVGGKVLYRLEDLQEYLDRNLRLRDGRSQDEPADVAQDDVAHPPRFRKSGSVCSLLALRDAPPGAGLLRPDVSRA